MSGDLASLREYAATRDEQALAAIIHQHQGLVYATCLRILGNKADAEDAAQECFLKLIRHAGQVQSSLAGWLHRCATHTCLNLLKQAHARQRREQLYGEGHEPETCDPDDLTWKEIAGHVDRAMEGLPPELRHILVETYLRQRPRTEVAEELGVSRVTLYRRLDEGVKLLRRRLREAGVVLSVGMMVILLEEHAAVAAPASLAAKLAHLAPAFSRPPLPDAPPGGPGGTLGAAGRGAARRLPVPRRRPWLSRAKPAGETFISITLTAVVFLGVFWQLQPGKGPASAAAPDEPAVASAAQPAPPARSKVNPLSTSVNQLLEGPRAAAPVAPPEALAELEAAAGEDEWFTPWITPDPPKANRGVLPQPPAPAPTKIATITKDNGWPFAPEQVVIRRIEADQAARRDGDDNLHKADEDAAERDTHRGSGVIGMSVSHGSRGSDSGGQVITKSSVRATAPRPPRTHDSRGRGTRRGK